MVERSHMLSAARGIHGTAVEPLREAAPSLRDELKRRLSELVDTQFTDDDLRKVNAKSGHFDWIISGTEIHCARVKKSSGCTA